MNDPIVLGILAGVAAWIAFLAIVFAIIWTNRSEQKREEREELARRGVIVEDDHDLPVKFEPCKNGCGAMVLVGAEAYHLKRCKGPKGIRVESRFSGRRKK